MRITLRVVEGPHEGREFSFEHHDNFIVGRAKFAHFQLSLKDKFFSRVHFVVEVNPPRCRLMDMGSTNGTMVNGRRVATADLHDGDLIRAGKTVLRVEMTGAEAGDSTQPEGPTPSDQAEASFLVPTIRTSVPWLQSASSSSSSESGSDSGLGSSARSSTLPLPEGCRVCGAPLADAGSSSNPRLLCPECRAKVANQPQPIDGYQIIRKLGEGGMGVVYQALRVEDGSVVALKTIRPAVAGSPIQIERFLREARILRQLDHPHIVAFRAVGESNDLLFFAMDYVAGTDVSRLQKKRGGPLPIGQAVGLMCQMLEALGYAHKLGYVHRDIKPGNLMVERRENRTVARLSDFGLARTYQASQLSGLTMDGELGGTMAYVAPEQIIQFRDAKPAADQYSAAAMLYKLLTNHLVYDLPERMPPQIMMILHDDPVPILSRRPDLPEGLADVVHRALTRDPAGRFPDVLAMRDALRPYLRHEAG